ncbi:MAG: D-alanyl-D-alanine carboxypeptidase/D-alanyl-D-alanine-endopeptidase [Rhodoferax sp.]|nr:D-alanyl-D-alanine carboxypeptidase/D-alanyl-D-alanine-endopeptidase [Rhodoferax sp.]
MLRPWPHHLALLALMAYGVPGIAAPGLPPEVDAALARAKVPRDAISVLVVDADGSANTAPRLSHRATASMNPASVMKLVTTVAALDLLGPAYTWSTPVYLEGAVREGTLYGNLYIKGQGDPKLVMERLWLLLRRLHGIGIQSIAGDIVLDNSAFEVPEVDPGQFDGEPLRPYNAAPDALLINYKSVVMTFTPDRTANFAQVQYDPPLAGVATQATVPLTTGDCGDYRGALRADFSNPARIRFAGTYPASCNEKVWPVAYADPKSYAVRAVQGMWQEMGGKLVGAVRMGVVPPTVLAGKPAFEVSSAPLAEIIRDINKYSNNVMAQQVFLTLGNGSFDAARGVVRRWWMGRFGADDGPLLENGSGLSRAERISAQALGRLLQSAYQSPLMPELMSSLPISGLDGTLRRMKSRTGASAHLKTGSLSNVMAVAGYVDGVNARRHVLVAIVNHANANAARPAIEALVDWASREP